MKVVERMNALKEVLEQEEVLWKSYLDEQIKALEMVLASLEFRYLNGECDVKELGHAKAILTSGLECMRSMKTSNIKNSFGARPPSPFKSSLSEEDITETIEDASLKELQSNRMENEKKDSLGSRSRLRVKRRSAKARSEFEANSVFEMRCRNPWNSECKNTDIELSIYYNGEFLPICRKCWQDISERNLEWSSY